MAFSTVKIYGDCDVNYLWSKSGYLNEDDINTIKGNGLYTPQWDSSTVMLANFTNSLSASNMSKSIKGYLIHRQNVNESIRYKVADVDSNITFIKDYNVDNKNSYRYYITPIYFENNEQILGKPIPTDQIDVDFNFWSVMSLDITDKENCYTISSDGIWIFYINIDGGTFKPVYDKTVMDGIGRFPKVYVGKKDYLTGSLSCYIGNVNDYLEYQNDDTEKIKKWRAFCNNGKLKLLKDIKGHVIPCEIIDTSYDNDDKLFELPTTISFNFTQIADNKDITVYAANS